MVWDLVKGLCEIHDDQICLLVPPIHHTIQVADDIVHKLNQYDNSETFVQSYISNNESLTRFLFVSTQCGANGGLVLTEKTIYYV